MKLAFLLFICSVFTAHANGLTQTISFSGRDVSITKVFEVVEKQTGYTFFANKELVNSTKPVSISANNVSLRTFLDQVFRDQPVDYEIGDKIIFLKAKPSPPVNLVNPVTAKNKEQFIPIQGFVRDSSGSPVQGATVSIKGSSAKAITDENGHFTIEAGPNAVLIISHVSFQTVEAPVNNRSSISFVLSEKLTEANQVVITALGIRRQYKALTYNVQEVQGSELTKVKDANFVNNLNGRVAGVTINSAASGIGGSARVVMRGSKSLFGSNNALYVIDGIPLPQNTSTQPNDVFQGAGQTGDGISNINPEDIESISVLTGPASAALYGSQAANGVVLINTKKGEAGKLNIQYSNTTSFFSPAILPEFQNRYGSNPGEFFSWGPKLAAPSTYDVKDFFQTGTNVTNAISLSTGTDKNQTFFSASAVSAKGIIPNNTLKRYNASVRNTSSFLDDKLLLDLSAMYISIKEQNMLSQGQYFNPLVPIYLFPRGDDIEKYIAYERYNPTRNFNTQFWPYGDMGFQMQNPHWIINRDYFINDKDRYILGAALKYSIADWVNVVGRVKMDQNKMIAEKKFYASTSGLFASDAGAYYNNGSQTSQTYADVLVSINKPLHRNYTLTANVGSSVLDVQYSLTGYGGFLQSVPNLFHFSNINTTLATPLQDGYHDQVQSVYGTAQLNYRNRLFVDVTGRNDWSSALANTTASSIFYPSIGVSGILTDLFPIRSSFLSFAKVRGSFSEVGNAPERFVSIATYPILGGFPSTTSYMPATELQPERTKSYEVGLNLKFFRSKVSLDVTAYHSRTFNQLFNPTLAPSTGFSSFYVNAGEVQNKGIEAALGYNGKIGSDLTWSSTATFTLNRNRIAQLLSTYTNKTTGQTISVDSLSLGGTGSYMMALVKGGSVGDIYVNTLSEDEHGYINVGLVSQTVTADPNRYIKAGNSNPRYNIGFRNNVNYKNFELSFLINARLGGVGVSITQAIMDRFGVSETSAIARDNGGVMVNGEKLPAEPYYAVLGGGVAGVGSMYVYDASNVRLAEASLSYTIPSAIFKNRIKSITVSAIGRNLLLFTKAPFDPESTANTGTYYQGIDYFMQPSLRSIGFSARVQF